MVADQLAAPGRDIRNPRVLEAMAAVPRHAFIPRHLQAEAYADHPLPIGFDQTISQPYIVAFMTQAIDPQPSDRVLEIGTGSGYQTAVLARLVAEVHTLEIVPRLARDAAATFRRLGIRNVAVHETDGSVGWPEAAPYDAILVTCAPRRVPAALTAQLRDGGRLIAPVGDLAHGQDLTLVTRHGPHLDSLRLLPVRFVPLVSPSETGSLPVDDPSRR